MSDITLTSVQRQTLLSLSQVTQLFERTQDRLNSGKKVNAVTDDAVAYFQSKSLYDRSSDIANRKSNIDQSIQAVKSALSATSAVDGLLKQLKGVLDGARGGTQNELAAATTQFKNIGQQLNQLIKDASYNGLNILTNTAATLATQFSERTAATFTISGYNLTSTNNGNARALFTVAVKAFKSDGTLLFSNVVASSTGSGTITSFSSLFGPSQAVFAATVFNNTENRIDNAISQLRGISAALGTSVAILQARSQFGQDYGNDLQTGGDKLTLADLNTESANSQALTLRQQLGIQSLSVSGQQNQSILNLLK